MLYGKAKFLFFLFISSLYSILRYVKKFQFCHVLSNNLIFNRTNYRKERLCHFLSVSQFFKPIISKYIKMNKLSIEKAKANLLIVTTDDSLLINNKIM